MFCFKHNVHFEGYCKICDNEEPQYKDLQYCEKCKELIKPNVQAATREIKNEDWPRLFEAFDEALNMQLLNSEIADILHSLDNYAFKLLSRADV